MNRHKKKMAEQFLNHALGIIYLLTGEEYTIVKKNSSRSSIHRLTGEVPIKCDDVAVYFSMDEWEFIEGQNEMYKDTMKEKENRPLKTVAAESSDLTGQCCENVQAEEEEREKLPQGETHSDLCTDLTGECENLQTEEEERNEIPQMETHSDLCTGEDTDVLNTVQHEDLCARSPQEISDSFDPGSIIARAGSTMGPRGSNRPRQHLTRGSASVAESVTVRPRPVLSSVSVGEVTSSQQHNLVMHKDTEPVRGDIQEFQENLFTVLVKEESEDSQQTENHSDLYADVSTHQFSGEESHMIACSLTGINEDEPNLHMKTEVENSETNPLKRSKFPDYGLLNSTVEYTCDQKEMIVNDYSDVICGTRLFNPLQITESDKLANTISEFDKRQVSLTEGTYEKSYTNKRPSSSHRGKKLLVCYECKKVFTKRSVLIIHQRTHTGEKPFICRMCGKGFAERSSLNRHHRTHTGERPNICSTCGKAFSERSNLIRHQLTHTRER